MLVCIYTAIPERRQFQSCQYPFKEKLKCTVKNALYRIKSDFTGSLTLDTHSYKVTHALGDTSNRGDIAIRLAVRSQLVAAFAPRHVEFIETEWHSLTDEVIEDINRRVDLFVIAGGGYIFIEEDGSAAGTLLADSDRLSKLTCPVIAFGIGLNGVLNEKPHPVSDLPQETRNLIERFGKTCNAIATRDQDTADLFTLYSDKRVSVVGDPVLCLRADNATQTSSGRLKIGINLAAHGWRSFSLLRPMLPHIVDLLTEIQNWGTADIVYLMHHNFERPIVDHLRRKGLHFTVVDGPTPQLIEAYNGLDFVINQMLHSCIFAANAGVPFLNLAYDRKTIAFCSLLGIPECAIEPSQVNSELLATFTDLLEIRGDLSKQIARNSDRLRYQNRAFLREVAGSIFGHDNRLVNTPHTSQSLQTVNTLQ